MNMHSFHICLSLLCLAVLTACDPLALLSARRTESSPRSTDPFIVCNRAGPTHATGLPIGFSEAVYANLFTLCSLVKGARQNVACWCDSAGTEVKCSSHLASPELWNAAYTPNTAEGFQWVALLGFPTGQMSFSSLCIHGCECQGEEAAAEWYQDALRGYNDVHVGGDSGREGLDYPDNWSDSSSEEVDDRAGSFPQTFGSGRLHANAVAVGESIQSNNSPVPSVIRPPPPLRPFQAQCGNTCSKRSDCLNLPEHRHHASRQCQCRAHKSQYQPNTGQTVYTASCLPYRARGRTRTRTLDPKQDEVAVCPCNATYISAQCCLSESGLVHEPKGMNLGILVALL